MKPSFVSHILETFEKDKNIVLHLDEVRNTSQRFYPFNNPSFEEVTGDGCINFRQGKTTGLLDTEDILHARNYGACMCARKEDLISIGGADEHTDYLGHICGPYEMTFRLVNDGKKEVWHQEEFLYHTGHPGTNGRNNYLGPHDGSNMSTAALNILDSGRKMPLTENKAIRMLRTQTKDLSKDPLETWIVLGPEIQTWKMNPWRLLASEHRTFWVRVRRKMRKLIQRNNTQSGVSRLSLAVATQLYTRIFWMSFKQLFYKTTSYGANKVMSKSMFFQIEQIFIYFGRIWKNNLYAVEICRKGIDQTIRDGVKEVVLNGANHVSGVLCLLAKETPLKVTGIYDAAMAGKNFLGFKVCPAEDLKGYEGKVMIASLSRISDKANHLQGLGIQKQHIVEFR